MFANMRGLGTVWRAGRAGGVAGAAVNRSGGRSGPPGHGARPGCGGGRGLGRGLVVPVSVRWGAGSFSTLVTATNVVCAR